MCKGNIESSSSKYLRVELFKQPLSDTHKIFITYRLTFFIFLHFECSICNILIEVRDLIDYT